MRFVLVVLGLLALACGEAPRTVVQQAPTEDCVRPAGVVDIGISSTRYPSIVAHVREAIAAGWPEVMTLNRPGADRRRAKLLNGIPARAGFDRDEYPMAIGRAEWRAHVAYVPPAENRGAGSVVGIKLRRYCDGTRFRIVGY